MIVDSCIFFTELDMLEFRLKMLWDHVDKFVIAEADHTFSGLKKPYCFADNRARFAWADAKIIHHPLKVNTEGLDLSNRPEVCDPTNDCWKIEYALRDSITDACRSFAADDILILSDVDEILTPEAIEFAKQNLRDDPLACEQAFFYYNLRTLRDELWCGSIFATMQTARTHGTQNMRNRRFEWPRIAKAGWHLSYFGGVEYIRRKINTGSHQEYNTERFLDPGRIERCIEEHSDLYDRGIKSVQPPLDFFPLAFLRKAMPYDWGIDRRNLLAAFLKQLTPKTFRKAA